MPKPPTNAPQSPTPPLRSFEDKLAGLLDWPEHQTTLWPQRKKDVFLLSVHPSDHLRPSNIENNRRSLENRMKEEDP